MKHVFSNNSMLDPVDVDDEALARISMILDLRRGFSISMYKDKCMKRRIAIRMRSTRCSDTAAYCDLLNSSDNELDLLKKTLTIHVSQFFRNPSMFEKLQKEVLPYLFQQVAGNQNPIRFHSLGSAGGEEAYSLGIILREYFPRELFHMPPEIIATDIDSDTIVAAKTAEYSEDRLKDLPESLKLRYFVPVGPRMQLSAEIRSMVSFCQRNIIDTATFERCQLVMCRNTLIYFTRPDQEKILQGVADILTPGGILVLGKSETLVGEVRKLFSTVCPIERIYRRL